MQKILSGIVTYIQKKLNLVINIKRLIFNKITKRLL